MKVAFSHMSSACRSSQRPRNGRCHRNNNLQNQFKRIFLLFLFFHDSSVFRQKNKRNKRILRLKSRDARPVRPHSNKVLTEVQKNKRLLINRSLYTSVLMSKKQCPLLHFIHKKSGSVQTLRFRHSRTCYSKLHIAQFFKIYSPLASILNHGDFYIFRSPIIRNF